ncbi:MAG: tRNA 4-thiouridine(8) synthase ThiI [Chloroflexi bacterium]|nr:tRNA 4-thiouridine(8) synthase ThiI [Chloroflexota bacterium]
MELVLLRYGELWLKGHNRPFFLRRLRHNVRDCLKQHGVTGQIREEDSRLIVYTAEASAILPHLARIFGVTSVSAGIAVPKDLECIRAEVRRIALSQLGPEVSFRIRARRADKRFPLTSPQLEHELGAEVQDLTAAPVDLSDRAAVTIGVEIESTQAIVYSQTLPGPGGLPLNTQGRLVALVSGGIDSPIAAWLMMKRGCGIIPVHFKQNEEELAKFFEMCEVLQSYAYGWRIKPIVLDHAEVFGPVYERLRAMGEERWTCVFCKRTLLTKASEVADQHRAEGIVTGESLGQVASQTLANLRAISYGLDKPILRPLIGMDKVETMALARRIGTFDISTRKSPRCRYVPANPLTETTLPRLLEIMARLEE